MSLRINDIMKGLIVLIICGIIGMGLLILSYLLPEKSMKEHVSSGANVYLTEGSEFEYAEDYRSTILDNYTDALILSEVIYPTTNAVSDAVNVPHFYYPGHDANDLPLFGYLKNNKTDNRLMASYARYWHGYLVILKPFYLLFDFSDMVIFNQIIQFLLLIGVIFLMQKTGLERYLPAFLSMIVFWNPATIGMSLQYSPCFYISITSTTLLLLKYLKESRAGGMREDCLHVNLGQKNFVLFFMLIGVFTSYFDFLTYPLATLCVPLIFYIILYEKNGIKFIDIIRNCIYWTLGYLGMWAEKWIIGSFLTGNNIVKDGIHNLLLRTSTEADGEKITRFGTIKFLIEATVLKWPYVILLLVLFVIIVFLGVHKKNQYEKGEFKGNIKVTIYIMIVGILPFLWFFLAADHSYVHPRLVYRIIGVTFFSWLSGETYLFTSRKKNTAISNNL